MPRIVTVSLSASSLPHSALCIGSLAENLAGDGPIHLLTDTPRDEEQLRRAFADRPRIKVFHSDPLWEDPRNPMRDYAGLNKLRKGHPCWRKLTDPMLLAADGDEVVVIDPDVYFPRPFDFEEVPDGTLRLMWQKPNCLLPHSVVQRAFDLGVDMADHVDIGVAQYRSPLDLDWLDWLATSLGDLPWIMHVEPIFWASLAMRMGGGYLNPERWYCWANTQWKRVQKKVGTSPLKMLQGEDFRTCLAFHAGGEAKKWLADPDAEALLKQLAAAPGGKPLPEATILPFVRFTPQRFRWLQRRTKLLRSAGYYKLIRG